MRINSNVYNYLSSNLVPKKRETTHKTSELREVSSNITKYNQNSPLYIISRSNSNQERMINIKESALSLIDAVQSFSNPDGQVYSQRVFQSEDDNYISGAFRSQNVDSLPDKLSVNVEQLATNQVNVGNYLPGSESSIPPGNYTFSLIDQKKTSNFSVNIGPEDTNIDIQTKLATYINNRELGVTATIQTKDNANAMVISSDKTGVPPTVNNLYFVFADIDNDNGISNILGLNKLEQAPGDSVFTINGDQHSSSTNHISINQLVELDFHKPTNGELEINFAPDTSYAKKQIDMFVDAYNTLVELSNSNSRDFGNRNLSIDVAKITAKHKEEFKSIGIDFDENGYMTKDDIVIKEGIESGRFMELFCDSDEIATDITAATNRLTLDPASYINKILVTYPNSKVNNQETYTNSIYSGLMYNNYA